MPSTVPPASTSVPPDSLFVLPESAIPPDSTHVPPDSSTVPLESAMPLVSTPVPPDWTHVPPISSTMPPESTSVPPMSSTDDSTSEGSALDLSPATWASISSQLDQQLTFKIGPSTSPPGRSLFLSKLPNSVTITPLPPRSTAGAGTSSGTGLFGSEIVAEVSRAPGRFKFATKPTPTATLGRKIPGQGRTSQPYSGQYVTESTKKSSFPSRAGGPPQTNRFSVPDLGPDVIIRPVISSHHTKNLQKSPKPNSHPGLQDSEIFQLLAGYRCMKDEVDSLKAQVADNEVIIQEILNNFTSEVAKLNARLAAVEGRLERGQGSVCGQGSFEHGQGSIEHGQGSIEHGLRSIEHGLGSIQIGKQGSVEHGQGSIEHGQGSIEHGQDSMEGQEGLHETN